MGTDMISPEWEAYLNGLVPTRPAELQAMEAHARATRFPIIGPASGQFCYFITRLIGATSVFEMGSGYGYSTAWFARAVKENGGGVVHHVVWDDELSKQARGHLTALGLIDLVEFHVGEAIETLRNTPGTFDVIFNDIDKQDYPLSLPVIRDHLRSGGVMITDNMLWHGGVIDPQDQRDTTKGVQELTRLVMTDPAWTSTLVPVRDGLLVAQKR